MPVLTASPETPLVVDTVIFTHIRNELPYAEAKVAKYFKNTKSFPALSSMTVFEANCGNERSYVEGKTTAEVAEEFRQEIADLVETFAEVLPFNQKAAEIAAYIYPRLLTNEKKVLQKRKEKNKKGNRERDIWQDVFIVSTAIAHNYGLASPDKDIELIAKYLPDDTDLRLAIWKA